MRLAHSLLPVFVGLAMGLMMPFALHDTGGLGAALFVLAHVAVIGAVLALGLLIPRVRRVLHRPSLPHMAKMGAGALVGFAVICLACTALFGMEHPWT